MGETSDPKGPAWTGQVAGLLRRVGVPVQGVRAGPEGVIVEVGDGQGGLAATVFMAPLDVDGRYYKATARHGFFYRTAGPEDAALLRLVDLAIAVLARLEDRIAAAMVAPQVRARAVPGAQALSLDRDFARRFPFASVDWAVGPDGRAEAQVLVRLTGRCNQDCPFCSAPILAIDPSDEDLYACLQAAAETYPGCLFTLTGGEPTLRQGWSELVREALATLGIGQVQVQTNAVVFARGRTSLPDADPRLLFFVSLHATDEHLYDLVTRSRGQFDRAIRGVRALLRAGHRVLLNAVVGSANAAHLPDLVRSVPTLFRGLPLPEVHVSVLMCPPHRARAEEWLIPYEDLVLHLRRAVAEARAAGVPMSPLVASTHASIPPCFLSPEERASMRNRPLVSPGETGYEDLSRPWVKARACRTCAADAHCLGVPAPYARRFGLQSLRPFQAGAREKVVPITALSLGDLDALVPEAVEQALLPDRGGVVLDLLPPEAVSPPDRAVSFSDLFSRMPEALRLLGAGVVRVRSRSGRPACLFPDVAAQALLPGAHADPSGPGAYAPACASCAARAGCGGVSPSYLARFGSGELKPFVLSGRGSPSWKDRARWLLVDHPDVRIPVTRLVLEEDLPDIPCTRPWTRLEYHDGGTYGPCCADYMNGRHFVPEGASPLDLWQSDLLRWYRSELLTRERPRGCRTSCPVLAGRLEPPARLVLRGGPKPVVENQLRMVEALLDRRLDADWMPTSLCVPVTSFCNYDCLMCECGQIGTLADQKPLAFWEGLARFLDAGAEVDANGGEPLASPVFRAWLRRIADEGGPPRVAVVTNGAFLTPRWVHSFPRLPFRSVTVSLNAATPETYLAVNRGLPWSRIRRNLDALLEARRTGRLLGEITYSMVILRANLREVRAFASLGLADRVGVRYLLPQFNRSNQSILVVPEAMREAAAALDDVACLLDQAGQPRWAEEARTHARILRDRLAAGLFEPIGNVDG